MGELEQLFFELIRVAIGSQETISRLPSKPEWKELFEMAVKQSLVGVCFSGLHNLGADSDDGYARIGISEELFFVWMGMAVQINMKNDVINGQCVKLQKQLAAEGFMSCLLKGQGLATLYGEELRGFRQSGDIDIYVDGGIDNVMKWVRGIDNKASADYVHSHPRIFDDTEVEVHYRFGELYNLRMNAKLQKWFEQNLSCDTVELCNTVVYVPSPQFNAFYLLLHIYRHAFAGGIGIRQVMDYYFFLKAYREIIDVGKLNYEINQFGMRRFAKALMWVLEYLFDMNESFSICPPDENEGKYMLDEIIDGGNFGHARRKKIAKTRIGTFYRMLGYSLHLSTHYGQEALWTPIWHVYHFVWKRSLGRAKYEIK